VSVVTRSDRAARLAAVLAAIGFASLAIFQAALAAGVPWGHAAWGGENADLTSAQQSASAVAAVVYVAAALIVLCRGGVIWRTRSNRAIFSWGTWFFAVATVLGAVPNLASQSRWENFILGPLALVLGVLCLVVARGAAEPEFERPDAAAHDL
jgi:hypothetical protein